MTEHVFYPERHPDDVSLHLTSSQLWQATVNIFSSGCDAATACTVLLAALTALDHNTGAIGLNKKKLAKSLDHPLELVEDAMSALAALGVFYYASNASKGFDRLSLNPRLAWTGSLSSREGRKAYSPPLRAAPQSLLDRSRW